MRLIDADALYAFVQDQKVKETGAYTKGKNTAFNIVKSALHNECATPTIDAVPVVRCKDCGWRSLDCIEQDYYCTHAAGMYGFVSEEDFCSYGERRGDG